MFGLLQKIWIEVRWQVLLLSLGLCIVMGLLTALLPKLLGNIDQMFGKIPMIKPLLTALLGVDPGDQITAQLSQAFLWIHPTVLALLWAQEVMFCSRLPAGEVDRGTADFLFCLPVSRWKLFWAETIGWLFSGGIMLASGYSGHMLSSLNVQPEMRLSTAHTLMVVANLGAVYLAVGCFSFLISSFSERRGRVIGIVFTVLVASYLLSVLAQFQDWAKNLSRWLSVMEYYRPAIIIQTGEFPWSDVVILVTAAASMWIASGIVFQRRSICTV